ncbi:MULTISPECIES: hypothetical protein [Streptosporangium]|uniref:Uncharacterized protein n=1 Tax=Streptosporangium brasiliense TaxID=47480 RepID=A0ABT9QXA7_9ACTN|nr:hypothetical protein [Streptosporangium brasiliense]MDP9861232.1 hypothetical protein [Streptosporangium brasiliense]
MRHRRPGLSRTRAGSGGGHGAPRPPFTPMPAYGLTGRVRGDENAGELFLE